MMQHYGNMEPMEHLLSFLNDWLGTKNRAILAAYYFSAQKQKNVLLRINAEGNADMDYFQEKFLHKTIQRSTAKPNYQSDVSTSFHNLFVDKFFENPISDKNECIYIFSYENTEDGKRDLLFIQFPQKNNLKKAEAGKQLKLGIEKNKELISEIVIVSKLIYEMQIELREQFDGFKTLLNHKRAELDNSQTELLQMKEHMNLDKLKIARAELDLMVDKFKIDYTLENSAIRKIIETEVDKDNFRSAMRKAYINTLGMNEFEDTLKISGEQLYFEAPSGTKKTKIEEGARMRKVENYLDKLEVAAVLVSKEDGKLTGENIGRKCDPILIPAAISDYNKRHQERIRMLMINRPKDWPTIRDFRPIINILTGFNQPEENRIVPGQGL